jgi:hypothetical protein
VVLGGTRRYWETFGDSRGRGSGSESGRDGAGVGLRGAGGPRTPAGGAEPRSIRDRTASLSQRCWRKRRAGAACSAPERRAQRRMEVSAEPGRLQVGGHPRGRLGPQSRLPGPAVTVRGRHQPGPAQRRIVHSEPAGSAATPPRAPLAPPAAVQAAATGARVRTGPPSRRPRAIRARPDCHGTCFEAG